MLSLLSKPLVYLGLALCVTPPSLAAQEIELADRRIRIANPQVLPDSIAPVDWIDSALGPDGSMYLADMYRNLVTKIGPDGRRVWAVGREGEGPGEFKRLYRIFVGVNGSVMAYDVATNSVSTFTADGEFVERRLLGFHLRQIDTMLWADDHLALIAGTASSRGTSGVSAVNAIHAVDDSLAYLFSFGPLPKVKDRRVLDFWGAGVLTGAEQNFSGRILYTVRSPYVVVAYRTDGSPSDSILVDVPLRGVPDDRFEISYNPAFFIRTVDDAEITVPLATFELRENLFLGGRIDGSDRHWTVFNENGKVMDDVRVPSWGGTIIAVDQERGRVWIRAKVSGLSHLVLGDLTISQGS